MAAAGRVAASRWIGRGPECAAFEKEFGTHLGADHVLLTNNCTSAIYLALRVAGIGPGDEVIVSTINFVACASAVVELGATPVFADVDPHTLNILPDAVARLRNPRTRAVIVLHYGGHPCDMNEIRSAAGDGVFILEDSANAIASDYHGQRCGTLGDAGVFSFDAMKILVMGDGGALVLTSPELVERAEALRYLGLAPSQTSGLEAMQQSMTRWWDYDVVAPSGRFISNDMAAAMGRVQLRRLETFLARRRVVWDVYQARLADVAGIVPPPEPAEGCTTSYYLYWIQCDRRDDLAAFLKDRGVYTTFRYYPLHQVPYYKTTMSLHNADRASETTLNLPLHQNLSDDDVHRVCDLVTEHAANRA
jgi:aminotransferase